MYGSLRTIDSVNVVEPIPVISVSVYKSYMKQYSPNEVRVRDDINYRRIARDFEHDTN